VQRARNGALPPRGTLPSTTAGKLHPSIPSSRRPKQP
jgi:hypothetical protein